MELIEKIKFYYDLYVLKRVKTYKVLEEAKKLIIQDNEEVEFYCCTAILSVIWGYGYFIRNQSLSKIIPNFNSKYLIGEEKRPRELWWPSNDRKSRIEAFDTLIKEYKESGDYIYLEKIKDLE